jgi:hypothetical protein
MGIAPLPPGADHGASALLLRERGLHKMTAEARRPLSLDSEALSVTVWLGQALGFGSG